MSYRELFHKMRSDLKNIRVRGVVELNPTKEEIVLLDNEKIHTDGSMQLQDGVAVIYSASYVIVEIQQSTGTQYDVYMASHECYQAVVQILNSMMQQAA